MAFSRVNLRQSNKDCHFFYPSQYCVFEIPNNKKDSDLNVCFFWSNKCLLKYVQELFIPWFSRYDDTNMIIWGTSFDHDHMMIMKWCQGLLLYVTLMIDKWISLGLPIRFHFLVWSSLVSRSQGFKVSRSQGLKVSRSQGLKVSRSQGGGWRYPIGSTGKLNLMGPQMISKAVEVIFRGQWGQEISLGVPGGRWGGARGSQGVKGDV